MRDGNGERQKDGRYEKIENRTVRKKEENDMENGTIWKKEKNDMENGGKQYGEDENREI